MKPNDLIKQIQENGLQSVAPLRMRGEKDSVLGFLALINDTDPMETDNDWWELRTMTMTKDGGCWTPY